MEMHWNFGGFGQNLRDSCCKVNCNLQVDWWFKEGRHDIEDDDRVRRPGTSTI